jgi:hypothetical protein
MASGLRSASPYGHGSKTLIGNGTTIGGRSQEHDMSLGQVRELIGSAGLRFVGFEFEKIEHRERYVESFPDDEAMTNLDNWERHEEEFSDTFLGMYQFWCQKAGTPD